MTRKTIPYAALIFTLSPLQLSYAALEPMNEDELEEVTGQASLINIDRFDFESNNFYQVKLNGTVEANMNVDKLQLFDSNGVSQIDIDDFSLSGDVAGISDGNLSSATLTNPFVEFAFAGSIDDSNARNREIIGIRVGADSMDGVMSFGRRTDQFGNVLTTPQTDNSNGCNGNPAACQSGINQFRGFLQTSELQGTIQTLSSGDNFDTTITDGLVGRTGPFNVTAYACVVIIGSGCQVPSTGQNPANGDLNITVDIDQNVVLKFPSVQLGTTSNPTTLVQNGITINTRDGISISETALISDILDLPPVPFELTGGGDAAIIFDTIFGPINLGTLEVDVLSTGSLGTAGNALQAISTIDQSLKTIHRAELDGNGFYLSAQNQALKWRNSPGSFADPTSNDVAQAGWWLSISNPVDLGLVDVTGVRLPTDSLTQIILRTNDVLFTQQRIGVPIGDALSGNTIPTDIGPVPFDNTNVTPIGITLNSQDLGANQNQIINCWNGVIGC